MAVTACKLAVSQQDVPAFDLVLVVAFDQPPLQLRPASSVVVLQGLSAVLHTLHTQHKTQLAAGAKQCDIHVC